MSLETVGCWLANGTVMDRMGADPEGPEIFAYRGGIVHAAMACDAEGLGTPGIKKFLAVPNKTMPLNGLVGGRLRAVDRGDDLLRGVVEIVGGNDVEAGLADDLLA